MKNPLNIVVKARIEREGCIDTSLTGDSMKPILCNNDRVIVVPAKQLSIGNFYLFELPDGSMGVHRLIAYKSNRAVLKGDKCERYEQISLDRIIGEAIKIMPVGCSTWIEMKQGYIIRMISCCLSKGSTRQISSALIKEKPPTFIRVKRFLLSITSTYCRKFWK